MEEFLRLLRKNTEHGQNNMNIMSFYIIFAINYNFDTASFYYICLELIFIFVKLLPHLIFITDIENGN